MRNRLLSSCLFLLIVVTDQITKFAVDANFSIHDSERIIGNLVRLTYIRNSGAAFGLTLVNPKIMFVVTVLVTILLFYLIISGKIDPGNAVGKIALVMILGGAVGNLIDRIRMGEVIDFIDMGIGGRFRWPVYNLADVYITLGMFLLIITHMFISKSSKEQ